MLPGKPVPAGSELRYGIENRGRVPLTFGICGGLERREGGGWSAVDTKTACIELAEVLRPGESDPHCCTIMVPAEAGSGEYRLVHTVNDGGRTLRLQAPVELATD
jgi:uncharacterized membrane protein